MSLLIILFLIAIPVIPLIVGLNKSVAPFGGPLTVVSLQLFLGVTLKSVYLDFHRDLFSNGDYVWLSRTYSSYELAIAFVFFFSVLMSFGYLFAKNLERKTLNRRYMKQATRITYIGNQKSAILIVVSVVSFFFILYLFVSSKGLLGKSLLDIVVDSNISKVQKIEGVEGFGNTNAFLSLWFVIPRTCMYLFFSQVIAGSSERKHRLGFITLILLLFVEIIVRGKRDDLASVFLVLASLVSLIKGKVFLRDIVTSGLFISMSGFIFSLITSLRGRVNASIEVEKLTDMSFLLDPIVKSTYFTDINVLASIIERMKYLEYMYGDSYMMFFYGLIPRAFWSDKPAISLGLFVKSEVLQRGGTLGGVPPTMPGEAFINFGWFGLFLAIIYGFCLRKAEHVTLCGQLSSQGLGIYIYSIYLVPLIWTLMQSSFAIAVTGTCASLAISFPLLYWAVARKKYSMSR